MEKLQNNYRYERKYILKSVDYNLLIHFLSTEGMTMPYPSRIVNNIYFDSLNFDSYYENIEGVSERNKYRLRWYGNRFAHIDPTFEIKMKRDQVNKKKAFKIAKTDFKSLKDIDNVHDYLLSWLESFDSSVYLEMANKIPTLLNGYNRDYFLAEDGEIRLTIDRNMYFYNCYNFQEKNYDDSIIVEVKYSSNVIPRINFSKYNLILGKSSKYVTGLNSTMLAQRDAY